jgi:Phage integrase family
VAPRDHVRRGDDAGAALQVSRNTWPVDLDEGEFALCWRGADIEGRGWRRRRTKWPARDGIDEPPTSLRRSILAFNRLLHDTGRVGVDGGDELRAIKRYLATRTDKLPWLFISEREAPLTRQAVNYIVRVAGEEAKLGRVWPHMLRHACGYYLAGKGTDLRTMQDYLGHRDPKHTAHYSRVAGSRFEGLWR